MRFANKVVIVTGGGKGIGEGCARVFCSEGGCVASLDLDRLAGERLAEELNATGPGRAIFLSCDVSEPATLRGAIDKTVELFGRMGTIEEIGRICLFLATDDSSFITGQAIEAEGGSSLDY